MMGDKPKEERRTYYCSFCGKSQHDVLNLIASPRAFICNECTDLCAEVCDEARAEKAAMGPDDVAGSFIEVTQQKTGAKLSIPIHPALKKELEAWQPNGSETFLATVHGQPFSVNGFYNNFSEWCQQAGLPKGCSPHGLRKAAARLLAEAGCTSHQIAAITGHRTLAEVERYTRAVEQKRLAEEAMTKLR